MNASGSPMGQTKMRRGMAVHLGLAVVCVVLAVVVGFGRAQSERTWGAGTAGAGLGAVAGGFGSPITGPGATAGQLFSTTTLPFPY